MIKAKPSPIGIPTNHTLRNLVNMSTRRVKKLAKYKMMAILKISVGCMLKGPILIQRLAPLISRPNNTPMSNKKLMPKINHMNLCKVRVGVFNIANNTV